MTNTNDTPRAETPPPDDLLTPEEFVAAWRGLIAEKKAMPLFSYSWLAVVTCEIVKISLPPEQVISSGSDHDPVRAFSLAYAAYRKGERR